MSLHKYMYANSNPVKYCDPSGHSVTLGEAVCVIAIIGALAAESLYIFNCFLDNETPTFGGMLLSAILGAVIAIVIFFIIYAISQLILFIITWFEARPEDAEWIEEKVEETPTEFEKWLNKGPSNNSVYFGVENDEYVYTGITRQNILTRLAQHIRAGKPFDTLDEIVGSLTRNQARAIEQYFIENGPNFYNKINSISPQSKFYEEALEWARRYLEAAGII